MTATVSGLSPVTFNAVGNLVSASIEATTATSQQAAAGSAVPQPPGVIVRDQFGAPRPGVTVTFAVTAGGGSITPSSVVTGSNGIAQLTNWTLGAGAGTNTVTATATGLPPVTFNATGTLVPASVQAATPTTQQGPAGQAVASPPGVVVRDQNDNPMQGITVTFAVTSGGGSLNPSSVITGADGSATLTSWTLGTAPGTNTVTATVSGVNPVTFSATGTRQATSIEAVTSTSQTVPAGGAVPEPPGVIVRDQNGLVMQGVSVAFAVTAGGGSINPASQSTGADGIARLTNWTVGSTAGTNAVTATVTGLTPVTFTATATLVATTMQATSPTAQQAPTGTPVSQPPGVIVRDHLNNPMQGVTVTFAVTAGGGSIAPSSVVTGANGTATLTTWTLGTSAGSNTVTASAGGIAPVTFEATGVRTATSLAATTAVTQQAPAGTAVSQPPGVLVRDHLNLPMPGVTVTFTVTAGGGAVSPTVVATGADGVAQSSSWTLGAGAGTNTVTASAAGLTPVTFTATSVLVPSSVLAVTPLAQEAAAGTAVSQPPGVIVRDQLGSPVPGITVSFAVTGGGGSAGPSAVVTGVDGIARVSGWTLGAAPGTNTLSATASGLPAVTFTATGIVAPGSIEAVTALSQQAPANSFVSDPPGVRVRNQSGALMSGVTVTFAVTSGTGTVSPGSVVTGGDGIARLASWRLGIGPGANSVVASVAGLPAVTFAATGTAVISSVQAVTPLSQSAAAGTQVQQPPGVIVRDQNNNPVQGVSVAFAAASGGGSVNPSSVTTNASGIAQLNSWTVGTGAGTSTATATVSGLPVVTFSATKLVPGSGSLQPVTAVNQQARVGTTVSQPPGVLVRDQNNNPLPGVSVSFAVTAGDGSASPASVITGSDGVARLTAWTLGGGPGTNTITAAVSGLPSLTFTATGLAPTTVVAVTALSQQAVPGAGVTQPPGVLVRDQNGNPLQGVTVAFAVTSGGGSRTPASVVTGANGVAQLTGWTLGGSPGTNTLTATVAGLTPVVFTATATSLPAFVQAASTTSQQAVAGTAVAELPAVLVRDQNNNPLQGVAVVFSVTAGGGSTFPAAQATGPDGIARLTNWTLGIQAGVNTITATVGTLPPVTFNATALLAASIAAITSTNQTVPVLGVVPEAPGVIVRNGSGAPMQGVPVVFEMVQEGGFVTPVIVPTGADGIARVATWRVGAAAGLYVLEASVRGLAPISFTANAVAPATAPASITALTAVSQSAAAGSNVAEPPAVIVRNSANEPLAGISVAFAVTGGGGTATPAAVLTGADGVAQLGNWTLGTVGGSNTLTATVTGLSPVAFTANATAPPPLVPTFLLAGTTTNQQAPAGAAVAQPPGVIVRDQHGQSLSGVNVTFTVTSGGGSVNPAIVQTSSGLAIVSNWTLGSTPGVNTLTATVPGLTPVTFSATGVRVASTVQALTPTAQQAPAGAGVASLPRVVVRDQNGNPLPGVNVSFTLTGGGGSSFPSVAQTDAAGSAQVTTWILGSAPGNNTLTASVAGVTPVVFTATGLASSTSQAITPTSQSAAAGAQVPAPPGVLIRDQNGNPMPGVLVTFSVTGGGGGISPDIVATAADGTARSTTWTLGSIPGTNTVTATAAGVPMVTFTATGTAVPATVTASTPTSQQAPAGSTVSQPPGVIVRDQNNNPLAGATVTFAVASGGGAVAPATIVTSASGVAQLSSWTLGPAAGANSVSATVGTLSPVTFSATGTLVATSIEPVAPLTQQAPVGMDVPNPPGVRVRDQNNNPLPGVGVLFTIASGGGSPSSNAQITGSDGIARANRWTLGPAQGSNTMTANVAGFAPVTFTAFGMTPTSMVSVTPASQEAPAGGAAPVPPGVLVTDQNQNPLPGVPVTFAVVAGGGLLLPNPPVVTTGSDGVARVASWALGTSPGTNTATAAVAGLPIVTFNATGLAGECPPPQAISLGPIVAGTLGSTGCRLASGELAEFYSFTITQQAAVRVTMSSAALDPYVLLLKATGVAVAENDDRLPAIDANSELFAILAPGSYVVAASSSNVGESGSFSLRVEPINPNVTGGETYFMTRGTSASQSLSTDDYDDTGYWSDFYVVYLQAGETVTIQMNSSQFDSYLMFLGAGGLIEDNNGGGGNNARIVYTSPTARYYLFAATSNRSRETGAYTLTVQ
ncbi:MAG TPA: Ig-like domain-containing protein [Gemmatimonadaceae bacterium]